MNCDVRVLAIFFLFSQFVQACRFRRKVSAVTRDEWSGQHSMALHMTDSNTFTEIILSNLRCLFHALKRRKDAAFETPPYGTARVHLANHLSVI